MALEIKQHISLQPFNTFGIAVNATQYVSISSISELKEVLTRYKNKPYFLLGGGSNMLLTKDIEAIVIHLNLEGIEILSISDTKVRLKVMAGENWHKFVLFCINKGYGGVENLSLIPGNVGTAPIQNIGAYGVELKDTFVSCEAWDTQSNQLKTITKDECQFGYRTSIFKTSEKGRYIITSVTFELSTKNHKLHTSYGAIEQQLKEEGIKKPTIKAVSKAVIAIRSSKLPNPAELGNSGSFFKNPVVDKSTFQPFITKHPQAPYYEVDAYAYKIPAGWLIEQAGFKGKRFGDAGVHKHQALVLINYGNASGSQIWELALKIQEKVKALFGISLEAEVNIF